MFVHRHRVNVFRRRGIPHPQHREARFGVFARFDEFFGVFGRQTARGGDDTRGRRRQKRLFFGGVFIRRRLLAALLVFHPGQTRFHRRQHPRQRRHFVRERLKPPFVLRLKAFFIDSRRRRLPVAHVGFDGGFRRPVIGFKPTAFHIGARHQKGEHHGDTPHLAFLFGFLIRNFGQRPPAVSLRHEARKAQTRQTQAFRHREFCRRDRRQRRRSFGVGFGRFFGHGRRCGYLRPFGRIGGRLGFRFGLGCGLRFFRRFRFGFRRFF